MNKLKHRQHIDQILRDTVGRYPALEYKISLNDDSEEEFTAFTVDIRGVSGDITTNSVCIVLQSDGENLWILKGEDFDDCEPEEIFIQMAIELLFKGAEWQEQQSTEAIQCLQELHEYYGGAGAELLTEYETELWEKVARIVNNLKKETE